MSALLTKKKVEEFYIFGCGELGYYLKKFFANNDSYKFIGFLDNKKNGIGIYKIDQIKDKNTKIIVASINYMYELTKQLQNFGFSNIVTYAELTIKYPELQYYSPAYIGLKDDYKKNKSKYAKLRSILSDEKSKKVLDAMIQYRQTFDINIYPQITDDINKQYFEDFMPKDIKAFADGGAFDGDTILRAFARGFNMDDIYCFEPDKNSLNMAKENLKHIKNVRYLNYGLSDKDKTLMFDSRATFGSCISENGTEQIKTVALDNVIKQKKVFIKLDIEGAELEAIEGAKELIKNGSPLSICVYHKPEDIWKIPEKILNINPNYKFYLRHYTNNIFDTILYGVPLND